MSKTIYGNDYKPDSAETAAQTGCAIGGCLGSLAFWGALIYIAVHFAQKYW